MNNNLSNQKIIYFLKKVAELDKYVSAKAIRTSDALLNENPNLIIYQDEGVQKKANKQASVLKLTKLEEHFSTPSNKIAGYINSSIILYAVLNIGVLLAVVLIIFQK